MENIYKIKIRSNPDPRGLYPSERRYSASTVLGLGVVHLALAATALLLASLSLTSNKNQLNPLIDIQNNPTILNNNSNRQELDIGKINQQSFENGLESEENLTLLKSEVNPSTESSFDGGLENNPTTSDENLDRLTSTEPISANRKKRSNNQDFDDINRIKVDEKNSFRDKTEDDDVDAQDFYKNFNPYTNLSLAPCVMSLGALAAGLSGLLAWKRWYIDHNIRWFFFMSIISTITSLSCVIITTIAIINLHEHSQTSYYNRKNQDSQIQFNNAKFINDENSFKVINEHYLKILQDNNLKPAFPVSNDQERAQEQYFDFNQKKPNIRFILALNILISCVLEVMWSILSAKIAFRGMRNTYPDDIVISRNRGKIEVNTVHKGNKKSRIAPPDILNHFPDAGKLAKYFPKIESGGNLPKAESNSEYQERVRQFLSSNNTDDSSSENK